MLEGAGGESLEALEHGGRLGVQGGAVEIERNAMVGMVEMEKFSGKFDGSVKDLTHGVAYGQAHTEAETGTHSKAGAMHREVLSMLGNRRHEKTRLIARAGYIQKAPGCLARGWTEVFDFQNDD